MHRQRNDPLIPGPGQKVAYHTYHYYDGWDGVPDEYKANGWVLIWTETQSGANFTTYHFERLVEEAVQATEVTKTQEELEQENAALRRQLETARMMVRDLATVAPINNKALQRKNDFLQQWDNPARLAELEQLVYKMLPNAKQIGVKGAMLVARRALSLGLDPFVEGNLHAYNDEGVIRVAVGYLGHRERIESAGKKMTEPRKMTDEERTLHGLRDGDHGAIVEVYDPREKEEYERMGILYRPVIGVGVWRPDEKRTFVPIGRSGYWRAETRATNDAGKRAVRQGLDALRWLQGVDATVSEDGDQWSIQGDAPAEWTTDPLRKQKAADKIAELGLTDEIVCQALGMDWQKTWMDAEDFFNFIRLLSDQRKRGAIDVEFTVKPTAIVPAQAANGKPEEKSPLGEVFWTHYRTDVDGMTSWAQNEVWLKANGRVEPISHVRNRIAVALNLPYSPNGSSEQLFALMRDHYTGSKEDAMGAIKAYPVPMSSPESTPATPPAAPESSPESATAGLVSDSTPVQPESTTPEPTAKETAEEWFGPKDTGEAVTPEAPVMVPASLVNEALTPEAPAPAKCSSCGLDDADPTSPYPTMCKGCGTAAADRKAAKTEKKTAAPA